MPYSLYSTNGTMNMRVRADNYDSDYIGFTIPEDLSSTTKIIVKVDNGKYLIRRLRNYKYHDLPIASKTSLGGIIVGDNLEIDSNGVLSSTGGGTAATIEVGTTTTGEAGSNASVTNSGTNQNAILDFVIPRGEPGIQGVQGEQGIQGEAGYTPVKGTDYFTEEDIASLNIPKKTSELTNDSNFVDTTYVEEKIEAIPVSDLLHYKGYVSSVDQLPTTGQTSGTQTSNHYSYGSSVTKFKTRTSSVACSTGIVATLKAGAKYWLYEFNSSMGGVTDYGDQGFGFCTNYPELIKIGVAQNKASTYTTFFFHIEYDPDKPVYYAGRSNYAAYVGEVYKVGASGTSAISDTTTLQLITEDTTFYKYRVYDSSYSLTTDNMYLYGNVPFLKYKSWSSLPIQPTTNDSNYYITGGFDSISFYDYNNQIYNYNDEMYLFSFEEAGCARLICNESLANENDVYTVGDKKDIYRCNNTPAWELWSEASDGGSGGSSIVIKRW